MKINLVSKSLENYLLNKLSLDNIKNINIDEIEEISINAMDESGKLNDYDFKDFEQFKNLKYVSLQNFIINNYQTNALNRCKNIEGIQFSNCLIKSKSRLQNNVKFISCNNCKKFKIYYVSLLKNLQILKVFNQKIVNLSGIISLKKLEKVYFENVLLLNFRKMQYLKNLTYIRLVKCKCNKLSEKRLASRIEIEK